jgi:hypothetical protein
MEKNVWAILRGLLIGLLHLFLILPKKLSQNDF